MSWVGPINDYSLLSLRLLGQPISLEKAYGWFFNLLGYMELYVFHDSKY